MGTLFIVLPEPLINVRLQLFQGVVQLLTKEQAIALVLHGPVEPLTDTIGLRMIGFGPGVVNVLDGQVELIGMVLGLATYSVPRSVRIWCSLIPCSANKVGGPMEVESAFKDASTKALAIASEFHRNAIINLFIPQKQRHQNYSSNPSW